MIKINTNNISIGFGKRLKAIRKANNLTQNDIAKMIGVSNGYVCFIERNDFTPSEFIANKLAYAFDVSVDYFYGIDKAIAPEHSTLGAIAREIVLLNKDDSFVISAIRDNRELKEFIIDYNVFKKEVDKTKSTSLEYLLRYWTEAKFKELDSIKYRKEVN